MGGGQDAHVHLRRAIAAHRLEASLLQGAQQLGLQLDRQLPDLVQQQRPAVGHLEAPRPVARGAGEGALDVAEQLALQQPGRDGGAVEAHERLLGARAPGVDGARQALLAGAGLAQDQDRSVRLGHLPRAPRQLAHGRAAAVVQHRARAGQLRFEQLGVGVFALVQAFEGGPLARALERHRQDLAVDLDQVHDLGRVGLAARAVERQHPQAMLAGAQRHDHAGVPVGQVEHAVEGIAVAVGMVFLLEGARAAGVERLADGRKRAQVEAVRAHALVGQRPARGLGDEGIAFEHEQRRHVVLGQPADPFQAASEQLLDRLLLRGQSRQFGKLSRGIDGVCVHARQPTTEISVTSSTGPAVHHRNIGGSRRRGAAETAVFAGLPPGTRRAVPGSVARRNHHLREGEMRC